MSDTGLAKIDGVAVERVVGERLQMMQQALADESATRALVKRYIEQHMVKGQDYGEIPGTAKPTLLKPGAEKLVDLFRAAPMFELVKSEEDFDRGFGFFNYIFKVELRGRSNGEVLAVGFGSANSREGRYRWRNAARKCPSCGKESIIKGKEEFGGGWLCWKSKGGCGAKWKAGAAEIEKQETGKVENDDVATLANTVLKMAKKRALVDGAIALARCSDLFTQDVEDMQHGEPPPEEDAPPPRRAPRQESARAAEPPPPSEPKSAPAPASSPVVDNPFHRLQAAMHRLGVPPKQWGEILKTRRGRTSAKAVTAEDVKWMEDFFTGALEDSRDSQQGTPPVGPGTTNGSTSVVSKEG